MSNLIFFNLFVHIISSIIRAYPNMERFGLIGMIENKKHMENIWLKILKIKFPKTIIARDLDQYS